MARMRAVCHTGARALLEGAGFVDITMREVLQWENIGNVEIGESHGWGRNYVGAYVG